MNLQSHANGSSATRFAPASVAIPAHHVSSRGRPGALVSHERLNMIRSPSVGGHRKRAGHAGFWMELRDASGQMLCSANRGHFSCGEMYELALCVSGHTSMRPQE